MADLADGESIEMQGSGKKPYILKNTGGVYSCTCPAWRNQSLPIESRTCKHLRKLRGDEAEAQRVDGALPVIKEKKGELPLLQAHKWDNDHDLTGWWMSEKLDGVRAYWDGKQFYSRKGNEIVVPDWFVDGLPDYPLDGELWSGRGQFDITSGIARRKDKPDTWKQISYLVFDAPELEEPFEDRMAHLKEVLATEDLAHVQAHDHLECQGISHLEEELERVINLGGEGLMLRQPGSRYEAGRSTTLYKVKKFFDGEARVIDYTKGRGRHKGRTGALVLELPGGETFSVGTGLSDAQRENPPEIGSVVAYRYQELTKAGIPRFPSFIGVRDDVDGSDPGTPAPKKSTSTGTKKTTNKKTKTAKKKSTAKKSTTKKATATKKTKTAKKQATTKKKTASKKVQPATTPTNEGLRYFEYEDEKSSKFWEISRNGCDVTVRYGRLGAEGTTKTKTLADETKAEAHLEKLIDQKTDKGYVEI